MLKHTAKNVRKEIIVPKLVDRERRGIWSKHGSKEIMMRAKERVDEILEKQKGPGISSDVNEKLKEYFKKISSRTYDDFRIAEGMDDPDTPERITGLEE